MDASSFESPGRAAIDIGSSQRELEWGVRFRTTRWSVIVAAASDGDRAQAALDKLYRTYFYPLLALAARRRGREAARELTQAFFVKRLLEMNDLRKVERRAGQYFRGWLTSALRSFLANHSKFERQQCRDVTKTVALGHDDDEHAIPTSSLVARGADPEKLSQRAQALTLLAEVMQRLKREYSAHARAAGVDAERRFELAKRVFLPGPDGEELGLSDCARELGMSADATKQLLARLRRRYGELLNEALVTSHADLATAQRWLREALETPSSSHG